MDKTRAGVWAVLLLMLGAMAVYAQRAPLYTWDLVPYLATVLERADHTPEQLHSETYAHLAGVLPPAAYSSLVAGPYAARMAEDVRDFVSQLPMYRVKPGYVWTLRLLHGVGVEPVAAIMLVSRAFFLAATISEPLAGTAGDRAVHPRGAPGGYLPRTGTRQPVGPAGSAGSPQPFGSALARGRAGGARTGGDGQDQQYRLRGAGAGLVLCRRLPGSRRPDRCTGDRGGQCAGGQCGRLLCDNPVAGA